MITPAPFSRTHSRLHGCVRAAHRAALRFLETTPLDQWHPEVRRMRARAIRLGDIRYALDARIERAFAR